MNEPIQRQTLRQRLAAIRTDVREIVIAGSIGSAIAVTFREPVRDFLRNMTPGERALAIRAFVEWLNSATNRITRRGSTLCEDCGAHGYGYMLKDDVWNTAIAQHPAKLLCMPCVVKRIGRPLTRDDLGVGLPINDPIHAALAIAGVMTWDEARAESSAAKHWNDARSFLAGQTCP